MKLLDIYDKPIDRKVNPAVVADNMDNEIIHTEIAEYVLSEEIINGLYSVLQTIKGDNQKDKKGIWINGYYGSGKSHFLKYIHYCMDPATQDAAFNHILEEIDKKDTFSAGYLGPTKMEFEQMRRWFQKAAPDNILFNVQTFSDTETKARGTFTNVFYNMFNKSRGLNSSNIRLAVLLEKKLQDAGLFDTFKQKMEEEEGFVWEEFYATLVHTELDTVLRVAHECDPSIDIESMKNVFLHPEAFTINIDQFTADLVKHVTEKGEDYRLVFLVDEVSQFINNHKDVLLDLQDLVEATSSKCRGQVIIACTAQQDMDDVADNVGISSTQRQDEVGKIMGRFETRVSLESTDKSYITKKRILSKGVQGSQAVQKEFVDNRDAILTQFCTNNQRFEGYKNEQEFIDCYPFVPYQFDLISRVFEGFQSRAYVQKEVKDNERSVLKITHVTAKAFANEKVGFYVPFDAFFNNMMSQNLIHKGQNAIKPALNLPYVKDDPFAARVVKVLFMISNLNEDTHQQLGSTVDNLLWLMISNVHDSKAKLRKQIEETLQKLQEENVIRLEKGNYYFYNEDEAELSTIIKNINRDSEFELETFNQKVLNNLVPKTKINYNNTTFLASTCIDEKRVAFVAHPDIEILFTLFAHDDPQHVALTNPSNKLIICLGQETDEHLRKEYIQYCKVMKYTNQDQTASTEVRKQSVRNFTERFNNLMETKLKDGFMDALNRATCISGTDIIDTRYFTGKKDKQRIEAAINYHLERYYSKLSLVDAYPHNESDLYQFALRTRAEDEYTTLRPITTAEKAMEEFINLRGDEQLLSDIMNSFTKAPFGWPETCVLAVLAELNCRELRSFRYNNEPRYPLDEFLRKGLQKTQYANLSIMPMQVINQQVINQLYTDWMTIFNEELSTTLTGEALCKELTDIHIPGQIEDYRERRKQAGNYPFAELFDTMLATLEEWLLLRDPEVLFDKIHTATDALAQLVDQCNSTVKMMEMDRQMSEYQDILAFVKEKKADIESLLGDYSQEWSVLEAFSQSKTPSRELRIASKQKKELEKVLQAALQTMQDSLVEAYTQMYVELAEWAANNDVETNAYISCDTYITRAKQCSSPQLLRTYLAEVNQEKSKLRAAIFELSPAASTPAPTPAPARYKKMRVPAADRPLRSAADIDEYLATLRKEMMGYISDDQVIIIE